MSSKTVSQCVPIICRIYESSPFYFDRTARAELKWSGSSNEIFISESNKTLHVHMIWADGNMTNTFVEYRKSFSTQIYLKQSIFPLENVILPPTTM